MDGDYGFGLLVVGGVIIKKGEERMKTVKRILLSEDLETLLRDSNAKIDPIGPFQLQNWVDWLIMHTMRRVKKQDILSAIDNYEQNWARLD